MIDDKDIKVLEEELYGCKVRTVHVRTEQAAAALEKNVGCYITIDTGETLNEHTKIEDVGECLANMLDQVLRPYYHGKLCVCGIGNKNIPADALGPEVTYNLPLKVYSNMEIAGNFQSVHSIDPGVPLTTNLDTATIIKAVVKEIGADCALLVDSICADDPARLFQTIQIASAGGICSYQSMRKVDWSALGIPVISIGVPTAIFLSSISPNQALSNHSLTSTNIQKITEAAGRIIAYAILRICWPSRPKAECYVMSGANKNPIPYSFLQEEPEQNNESKEKI